MPINLNRPKESIATPPDGTLTITRSQQAADEFMKALATVSAMIPLLEAADLDEVEFVRTHQNVPMAAIRTAIAGVEQTPELQGFTELEPVVSAEKLQFLDAFFPVYDAVALFKDNLKFTLEWKVATLSDGTLQVYQAVKAGVRGRRSAASVALTANLKRDLAGRANRKTGVAKGKAKAAAEAATAAAQPKVDAAIAAAPPKPDATHVAIPPKEVRP